MCLEILLDINKLEGALIELESMKYHPIPIFDALPEMKDISEIMIS